MVGDRAQFRSPHLKVKTAYELEPSVMTIPWKVLFWRGKEGERERGGEESSLTCRSMSCGLNLIIVQLVSSSLHAQLSGHFIVNNIKTLKYIV